MLGVGVSLSYWGSDQFRAAARDDWLNKGRAEAASMTETVMFRISKSEVNLRTIVGQIQGLQSFDPDQFSNMVERSNSWDSEIQFGNVGYAQRIARNERDAYEEKLVGFLSVVDDPRTRAPEAFEHFGVRVAERDEGVLHVNSDLVTHDAIRHTVLTATRVPSEAILGPAFRNSNDEWYSVMALATELYGTSGVMVATINLERFFDAVSGNALPPGMAVRVIERENESGEETRYKVIIDKQHANDNAVATEVIRITLGQARWNLHWDIMSNYLGGPDRTTETLVWRGGLMLTMMISCILGYSRTTLI